MFFLFVFALIGAAACAPQVVLPLHYGMMAHHMNPLIQDPFTKLPLTTAGVYGFDHRVLLPSFDMARSSLLPKPVEDTPEVKLAKANFALEYQKALMGIHGATGVVRAKRDISGIIPISNTMPYISNIMPMTRHINPIFPITSQIYSNPIISHI